MTQRKAEPSYRKTSESSKQLTLFGKLHLIEKGIRPVPSCHGGVCNYLSHLLQNS